MQNKKHNLSERMKRYEGQTDITLIPNLPIIIRLDGKAFHTWTRGAVRPYDERIQTLFDETTKYLVGLSGAVIGYTQSDEITLILHNCGNYESQLYFDGRHSKLVSVLASAATAKFNSLVPSVYPEKTERPALFDCRAWNVPSEDEAVNCLIWRELDATRNSISMAAQAVYSHKELQGKSSLQMLDMLFTKGIDWHKYPDRFRLGGYFKRREVKTTFQEMSSFSDFIYDPDAKEGTSRITKLKLPRMVKIVNRVGVVFGKELPLYVSE